MKANGTYLYRLLGAAVLVALAVVRALFHARLEGPMDTVFFGLLGAALVLVLVPVENIQAFKTGGLEVVLRRPEVQGAIAALGLDRIEDDELRERLEGLSSKLPALARSRVLWIDDRPHKLVPERRLLRALGVEVVPAISSEEASRILETDNDFDLILSDVQRKDRTFERTGGVEIHGGVNFVKLLREHDDPVIRSLPVIFYAAYDWARLVEFTRPARELQPEAEITNRAVDLFSKVIQRLAESRSRPIAAKLAKEPTTARE